MQRILSLALCLLMVSQSANLVAQDQNAANGVISGRVSSTSGRPLSNMAMHLVDTRGTVVGKTVTSRDGDFTFPAIALDTYTVQCIEDDRVIGTSSVILKTPTESVKMTCAADVVPFWKKGGVVAGLVAAAAAIGAAAVVATNGDASGAR